MGRFNLINKIKQFNESYREVCNFIKETYFGNGEDNNYEMGDIYYRKDCDESFGYQISKGDAFNIATRDKNLKSDFCRASKTHYTYICFKDADINLIELNGKKYWKIQVLDGEVSGSIRHRFNYVEDWDGDIGEGDLPNLRCLVNAENGEYIYVDEKTNKKMQIF